MADEFPFNYIMPYIYMDLDLLALQYAQLCELLELTSEKDSSDPEYLDHISHELAEILEQLQIAKQEIQIFHERQQLPQSQDLQALFQNLDDFLTQTQRTQNFLRDTTSRHVSLFALEESKKSIQQVESSKRLAQLAYIYLPLAFSSSLFGMNVQTFQNSALSSFIITAVVLLAGSLLLWWSFIPLQKLLDSFKSYPILFARIPEVGWRSPSCALILVAFSLRFGLGKTRQMMAALALFAILVCPPGEVQDPAEGLPHLEFSELEHNWWLKGIDYIRRVTHEQSWAQRTLWTRAKRCVVDFSNWVRAKKRLTRLPSIGNVHG